MNLKKTLEDIQTEEMDFATSEFIAIMMTANDFHMEICLDELLTDMIGLDEPALKCPAIALILNSLNMKVKVKRLDLKGPPKHKHKAENANPLI